MEIVKLVCAKNNVSTKKTCNGPSVGEPEIERSPAARILSSACSVGLCMQLVITTCLTDISHKPKQLQENAFEVFISLLPEGVKIWWRNQIKMYEKLARVCFGVRLRTSIWPRSTKSLVDVDAKEWPVRYISSEKQRVVWEITSSADGYSLFYFDCMKRMEVLYDKIIVGWDGDVCWVVNHRMWKAG